ncbi:xanthine dehydrogenase accessory protein XdhC [Mariniblastus fucicola]|uniref:XdhC and CoxI family protein n=1 Tax=Mariniblastus fucicola TaxID=980251 RepID=A0A5B9P6X8_9BACT|nr:xanthine dehydrogenase accessory protein XdhC [Mariniblastus fucicola]QEG20762.1 XdhC and CoxI family protein [Mariniblastus fucicola]
MPGPTPYIEALSTLAVSGQPFVSVTMIEATGSTPQDAGSKMLVDESGRVHGTVGGGKVEHQAIEHALAMLRDPARRLEIEHWNLQRDVGMTCGGWVKLFFEVYNRHDWHIVVFGAGHVAQALVKVLLTLDCRVTCVDPRCEWIDRMDDHERLSKICVESPSDFISNLRAGDYVICMTMGHSTDRPILKSLFETISEPVFVGVIGSKSKRGVLLRELKSDGVAADIADQIVCPVGLPIGSNQPAEIAISIAAQLLQQRDQLNSDRDG